MMINQLMRKDITIWSAGFGLIHSPDDIANAENYYRKAIYDKLNGDTVGKTVFIGTNNLYVVRAVMKAAWDLGCAITTHEGHPAFRVAPEFKDFFNFIDIVVASEANGSTDPQNQWMVDWLPEKKIYFRPLVDDVEHPEFFPTELNLPVDENTVAVKTHTYTTTTYPHIVDFTHRHLKEMIDYVIKLNDFTENDRPAHTKTLHHGSSFVNYAVPLFILCKDHFYVDYPAFKGDTETDKIYNLLLYIKKHKITRWLIPHGDIRKLADVDTVDLDNRVSFNVLIGPATADGMKDIFDRFKPKQIINQFGASDIGLVFASKTTKENIDSYFVSRFEIVNPNIEYKLNENSIDVSWKSTGTWVTLPDKFTERDNALWLWGNTNKFMLPDGEINLENLRLYIVNKYANRRMKIIADYEIGKLYLTIFDPEFTISLSDINEDIRKNYKDVPWGINNCFSDLLLFEIDHKVDSVSIPPSPLLMYYFRKKQDNGNI